jgi:hypothetical protein
MLSMFYGLFRAKISGLKLEFQKIGKVIICGYFLNIGRRWVFSVKICAVLINYSSVLSGLSGYFC